MQLKNTTGVDFWKEMSVEEAVNYAKEHNVEIKNTYGSWSYY